MCEFLLVILVKYFKSTGNVIGVTKIADFRCALYFIKDVLPQFIFLSHEFNRCHLIIC